MLLFGLFLFPSSVDEIPKQGHDQSGEEGYRVHASTGKMRWILPGKAL